MSKTTTFNKVVWYHVRTCSLDYYTLPLFLPSLQRQVLHIVLRLAEQSMIGAIEEVKALSHYETEGEARNTM